MRLPGWPNFRRVLRKSGHRRLRLAVTGHTEDEQLAVDAGRTGTESAADQVPGRLKVYSPDGTFAISMYPFVDGY